MTLQRTNACSGNLLPPLICLIQWLGKSISRNWCLSLLSVTTSDSCIQNTLISYGLWLKSCEIHNASPLYQDEPEGPGTTFYVARMGKKEQSRRRAFYSEKGLFPGSSTTQHYKSLLSIQMPTQLPKQPWAALELEGIKAVYVSSSGLYTKTSPWFSLYSNFKEHKRKHSDRGLLKAGSFLVKKLRVVNYPYCLKHSPFQIRD